MISSFFLTIFYGLLNLLVGFLPTGNLPTQIVSALSYFFGVANLFSYVIPITTIFQAIVVVIAFDGIIMLWHFINWIIRKIPGMQ